MRRRNRLTAYDFDEVNGCLTVICQGCFYLSSLLDAVHERLDELAKRVVKMARLPIYGCANGRSMGGASLFYMALPVVP